jgi:hypothetical protein
MPLPPGNRERERINMYYHYHHYHYHYHHHHYHYCHPPEGCRPHPRMPCSVETCRFSKSCANFCLSRACLGKSSSSFFNIPRHLREKREGAASSPRPFQESPCRACTKRRPVFECFPYDCPEPVLVKRSRLYINGSEKPFFITRRWNPGPSPHRPGWSPRSERSAALAAALAAAGERL